jgi:hypothetical protein
MTGWHWRLVIVGLMLILGGFIFSLIFSWSVDHQARLVAHDAYQTVFEQIARNDGDESWRILEEEISRVSVAHRRAADVHGHSINMGILLILLGLLAPLLSQADSGNSRVLLLLALSSVVYPAGLLLQFLTLTVAGEVVSAIGAAGAILALAALYVRVWKAVDMIGA